MKLRLSIAAALVLCGLLLLAHFGRPAVVVSEHSLGKGPTDSTHYTVSADGRHIAFAAPAGAKRRVVVDGVPGKAYGTIADDNLVFSPEGKRLAYVARSGSKEFLVVDQRAWQPVDRVIPESVTFSPDGRHVACVVNNQGKQVVALDGVLSKFYDRVDSLESSFDLKWLYFSPDGKRLAFVARRSGEQFAVLDGVEGKPYDWIGDVHEWMDPDRSGGEVRFSPDSKHVAYAARKGTRWFVVMDGVEGSAYGTIQAVSVANNGRLGYVAGTRAFLPPRTSDPDMQDWWVPSAWGKLRVIIDGHEVEQFDWREDWDSSIPVFSPDGKHVVFKIIRDRKQHIVVDGRRGKGFDEADWVSFSPDSRRYAYVGQIYSRQTYSVTSVVNGVETVDKYPKTVDHTFVVDGREGSRYARIQRITFSPENRRTAYMAAVALRTPGWDVESWGERLRWSVVVDGRAGRRYVGLYDYMGISFSPDGRHVSYRAFRWIRGIKRHIVVLDEKEYHEGLFAIYGAGGKRTAVACRIWPKKGLYIILDGKKRLTVLDTKETSRLIKKYGYHVDMKQVLFTQDGKHVGYAYSVGATRNRTGIRHYIGMDGRVLGEYDRILETQSEPQTALAPSGSSGITALAVRNGELLRVEVRPGRW